MTSVRLIGFEGNITSKDVTHSFKMAVIRTFFKSEMGDYRGAGTGAHFNHPIHTSASFRGNNKAEYNSFFHVHLSTKITAFQI